MNWVTAFYQKNMNLVYESLQMYQQFSRIKYENSPYLKIKVSVAWISQLE